MERKCLYCEADISGKVSAAKYCSNSHRVAHFYAKRMQGGPTPPTGAKIALIGEKDQLTLVEFLTKYKISLSELLDGYKAKQGVSGKAPVNDFLEARRRKAQGL